MIFKKIDYNKFPSEIDLDHSRRRDNCWLIYRTIFGTDLYSRFFLRVMSKYKEEVGYIPELISETRRRHLELVVKLNEILRNVY